MASKIWQIATHALSDSTVKQNPATPECITASEGSPLLARLLWQRGLRTPDAIQEFLDLEAYQPTSGLTLPDMDKAVARLLQAIDQQEAILIFGDFDVDGITGTAVLYETLSALNAKVSFYIPDRATEGHGLNVTALCRLVSTRQIKLVISTDTGISNFNEVSLLNGLGIDTIITDHHELPENLPQSVANVNPKLMFDPTHPLSDLAGVGVAFKLCELLLAEKQAPPEYTERLLELVAIGTVADLAPLLKENRYLVYRGVQVMNRRGRLGVATILQEAGVAPETVLTSETVGFTIGPRLNAIGRLDNATDAVKLLTTTDPEEARTLAARLEFLNRRRQELCDQTTREAEQFLRLHNGLDDQRVIALASPDWNVGIIGIVASRLIERYHVPVFLMVIDEEKGEVRGSARSIPGFHIHEVLHDLGQHLIHYGGHSGAGGFALKKEQLEAFKRALYQLAQAQVTDEQMRPVITADARLDWEQLNPHLVSLIQHMAPFGKDNPAPKFILENCLIGAQRVLGAEGKHLKLMLKQKGQPQHVEALLWSGGQTRFEVAETYRFLVTPELNTYNGTTKLQLIINDFESEQGRSTSAVEATVEPTPAKVLTPPKSPLPVEAQPTFPDSGAGLIWVDHRSREGLESFISQLMLPIQDREQVLLYHEGRPPQIPLLDSAIVSGRNALKPVETLILWDLPPTQSALQNLLDATQPKLLHLLGGKYQQVPIFQSGKDYLKIILRTLLGKHHQQPDTPAALPFQTLASEVASTESVILSSLTLLQQAGFIRLEDITPDRAIVRLNTDLLQSTSMSLTPNWFDSIEFITLQHALSEVGRYRDWLLRAPLALIQSSVIVKERLQTA